MNDIQNVVVLGATGSIGASTLDVIERNPERYNVFAITGHRNTQRLAEIAIKFDPAYIGITLAENKHELAERLPERLRSRIVAGMDEVAALAAHPETDVVMAAIVGAAGLLPTLAAVQAGKRVLLSNKESLVMAGALFMEQVIAHGATLLPVDSEHNAIFQSMPHLFQTEGNKEGVRRVILTASGGPFREAPIEMLHDVTVEQACAHPNWSMGQKISIDSATMMNKGLEVIEACWLFDLPVAQVEVVIHPQSTIHSLVQYIDGSTLAQLGCPDMRTPIAHALAWPRRIDAGVEDLDLAAAASFDFFTPDFSRFPCLKLAFDAMHQGGAAPIILNAANEVAVSAFMNSELSFTGISGVIDHALQSLSFDAPRSINEVIAVDGDVRSFVREAISSN